MDAARISTDGGLTWLDPDKVDQPWDDGWLVEFTGDDGMWVMTLGAARRMVEAGPSPGILAGIPIIVEE